MAKKTRKVPDVNSSSMADIAFLLLTFFLVTSSMDTDSGLARRLPPPPQDEEQLSEMKVQRRNLMQVLVNSMDQTMVGDEQYENLNQLQGKTGKQEGQHPRKCGCCGGKYGRRNKTYAGSGKEGLKWRTITLSAN